MISWNMASKYIDVDKNQQIKKISHPFGYFVCVCVHVSHHSTLSSSSILPGFAKTPYIYIYAPF